MLAAETINTWAQAAPSITMWIAFGAIGWAFCRYVIGSKG